MYDLLQTVRYCYANMDYSNVVNKRKVFAVFILQP